MKNTFRPLKESRHRMDRILDDKIIEVDEPEIDHEEIKMFHREFQLAYGFDFRFSKVKDHVDYEFNKFSDMVHEHYVGAVEVMKRLTDNGRCRPRHLMIEWLNKKLPKLMPEEKLEGYHLETRIWDIGTNECAFTGYLEFHRPTNTGRINIRPTSKRYNLDEKERFTALCEMIQDTYK